MKIYLTFFAILSVSCDQKDAGLTQKEASIQSAAGDSRPEVPTLISKTSKEAASILKGAWTRCSTIEGKSYKSEKRDLEFQSSKDLQIKVQIFSDSECQIQLSDAEVGKEKTKFEASEYDPEREVEFFKFQAESKGISSRYVFSVDDISQKSNSIILQDAVDNSYPNAEWEYKTFKIEGDLIYLSECDLSGAPSFDCERFKANESKITSVDKPYKRQP